MDHLEIIEHPDNNVVILDKTTNRYFHIEFPKQINAHGFRKLNAREILLDRLKRKDFLYTQRDAHHLFIQIDLVNKTRSYSFTQTCAEAFPDEWIDLANYELHEDVVSYMDSLQRKLHTLTARVERMDANLDELDEVSRRRIEVQCNCSCTRYGDRYY